MEPNAEESEDTVLARHRQEKRALQAKIWSMKKMKADKKRKKEILEEIVQLEEELETRHAEELRQLASHTITEPPAEGNEDTVTMANANATEETEEEQPQKISKAQRRREKKSQDNREREAQIKAEEAMRKDSPRLLETKSINQLLAKRQLVSFPVPPDGDCLYNAINHQLGLLGICDYKMSDLRQLAANYIEENRDTMICYMSNPDTGDMLSEAEFKKYCHQVRRTKSWGGEIEIKALSTRLNCSIEVIQATGPSTIHGQENSDKGRHIVLTYHRHMYSLGEHYNSTQRIAQLTEEETPSS